MITKALTILLIFLPCLTLAAGDLDDAMTQSAAGMRAQSARMKVISQNIANSSSTGDTPGAEPYRRKIIYFKNKKNPKTGQEILTVDKTSKDMKTPFEARYDPAHPAADENGYVLLPNVQKQIETLDMKEAQRSYQSNLSAIETSKRMYMSTIDLLR